MWLRGGLGEYSFSTGDKQRKRAWGGAHTLGKVLLHYSSPTVPFFGTDEGSLPRGRAATSFYQLFLGLIHS